MADNRYRQGIFVGRCSRQEERARRTEQILSSPLTNGWQPIALLPDGRRVWQLENHPNVTMHRMSQEERDLWHVADEWIVEIDGRPYASYGDSVEDITADVLMAIAEMAQRALLTEVAA